MPLDPRNLETQLVGTPTRDGAVDPRPGDFLGPTNAGEDGEQGNPHGPHVISPGIHALQDVRPVRPGEVDADPEAQDAAEREHLVTWHPDAAAPEPEEPEDPEEPGEDGDE